MAILAHLQLPYVPTPSPIPKPDEPQVYTKSAYGMVGTGRTPEAAHQALMEQIRQAGER